MKIAHFGTFDVDNYGDLLFPYIAKYRYPDINWTFVSPTNSSSQFTDSIQPIDFNEANKINFDAIIIGGGNIIHTKRTSLEAYHKVGEYAYPNLWIGAAKMAMQKKIPFAFNAPGISNLYASFVDRILFKVVFRRSNYISFREENSVNFAKKLTNKEVKCIPDTALEISKVWPYESEEKEKKLTINLNQRYHKPANVTAILIDKIANELKLSVEIVVIGDCHGDLNFSKEVMSHLKSKEVTIKEVQGLKELAHTIASSSYFIGSSMHAFITAISYRTPCLLVLNESPMHKFTGLTKTLKLDSTVICSNWGEAINRIKAPAIVDDKTWEEINIQLNNHWADMIKSIQTPPKKTFSITLNFWKSLINLDRRTFKFRIFIKSVIQS